MILEEIVQVSSIRGQARYRSRNGRQTTKHHRETKTRRIHDRTTAETRPRNDRNTIEKRPRNDRGTQEKQLRSEREITDERRTTGETRTNHDRETTERFPQFSMIEVCAAGEAGNSMFAKFSALGSQVRELGRLKFQPSFHQQSTERYQRSFSCTSTSAVVIRQRL